MTIKLPQAYESSRRQTYVQEQPRQVRAQCYAAHFQLRDLIISPVSGKLAKANGNSIDGITFPQESAASSDRIQTTHLFDLPFAPVCFSYGCGLVALGGQASELSIRTLQPQARTGQTGWDRANFSLGSNINNSVAIVPRPGSSNLTSGEAASPSQARLILSNNDQSIGIWDVQTQSSDMTPLEAEALQHDQAPDQCPITLKKRALLQPSETAINYCSISKDGRYMAAVGDTNEVFFYSCPRNANDERDYQLMQTARASDDAMFSADWSRDNATCAVAAQDGLVSLFDVRFLRSSGHNTSAPSVVTSFATSKAATASRARGSIGNHYGMSGAARTVKFSPGCTTELLAFTEQSRCFHLVDARSLDPSTHRVCELPRSSNQAPHRTTEDGYWRSLLHPLGSHEPDLSRHARLRVERERDSPTASLLGATRQRLRRQEESLAAWALEDEERPRPCIDQSYQDAPILDMSNTPDPLEGQSLHSFFYGDSEHDGRQPPWRRDNASSSSSSAHRPLGDVDMDGPQLQPDGSLTLGPASSRLPSARTLRTLGPDRSTRSDSEDAELRASLGLLNMPAWSDVSAHDPFSISGMDWDPHGERLYLATSTTAYEYQVNLCGRNSLPEAVWV